MGQVVYYITHTGADVCTANDDSAKFALAIGTKIGMGPFKWFVYTFRADAESDLYVKWNGHEP